MDWAVVGNIGEVVGPAIGVMVTAYFYIRNDRKKTVDAVISKTIFDITQKVELENKIGKIETKLNNCQVTRAFENEKRFASLHEEIMSMKLSFSNYNGTVKQAIENIREVVKIQLDSINDTVCETKDLIMEHIKEK